LATHSNLLVEFTKSTKTGTAETGHLWQATIWDPLGNIFTDQEADIAVVGRVLKERVKVLLAVQRVGSERVGVALPAPDLPEFFGAVRANAEKFHSLIHAANQSRLLGNVSFRCTHGFPSFRAAGEPLVYVSRRNIDKRDIGAEGFVAVQMPSWSRSSSLNKVLYYGDHKPSVDTPVQLRLYAAWGAVNYMLHSHAYIRVAPMTKSVLPCGAIEEAEEVIRAVDVFGTVVSTSEQGGIVWGVNLRGHGSIAFSSQSSGFENVEYVARAFPERQLAPILLPQEV